MQFNKIYAPTTVSISDFKKNPMSVVETGSTVAVLNNNKTVFYAVPCDIWEQALKLLEDHKTLKLRSTKRVVAIEKPENRELFIDVYEKEISLIFTNYNRNWIFTSFDRNASGEFMNPVMLVDGEDYVVTQFEDYTRILFVNYIFVLNIR